jgi:hypothetical protein
MYRSQLQGSRNAKGFLFGLGCPKTSVRIYYYTRSKNTDKRKSQDSLKVDSHKDGFSKAGNTSLNGKVLTISWKSMCLETLLV